MNQNLTELKFLKEKIKTHYDVMMATDFKEPKVPIWTFLCDDRFLGKSTNKGEAIFPVWRDALIETFCHQEKTTIVLTGSVRTGKCHLKGTKILMYDGTFKTVENLCVGDLLMGIDSTPRKVCAIAGGRDLMYEIIPNKGKPFVVNKDHILSLKKTNAGMLHKDRWHGGHPDHHSGKIVNISVVDYLKWRSWKMKNYHLWRVGVDFPEVFTPIDPYFLGVWLGDGDSAVTCITTGDREIKEYIYKIAKSYGLHVRAYKDKRSNCSRYRISRGMQQKKKNILLDQFRSLNLIGNKHIPQIYKANSRDTRLRLLAGLLDTDGFYSQKDRYFEFSNINLGLCEDVMFIARSLGFGSTLRKRVTTCNGKKFDSYRVGVCGDLSVIPCLLHRKMAKKRTSKVDVLRTGFSVRSVGVDDYYGFTVDGDHQYLLEDFTVCHNTTIAVYGIAYILYELLILNNPWDYFGLTHSSKMAIIFFNLTKNLGGSRGYAKLQACLAASQWFREHASRITEMKNGEELSFDLVEFLLASPYSKGKGIVGSDVVSGLLDEVDSEDESLTQKKRVLNVYNAAEIRFKTSFAAEGHSLGKLFIVSSKTDELSFMDAFIAERKKFPEVLIFDVPLWEARPSNQFCGRTFRVAVGDAFNPPKIIVESEEAEFKKNGYSIIMVPVEFESNFKSDIVRALREIAGVTVAGIRKSKLFASKKDILDCMIDRSKINPVKVEVIETGLKDTAEYIKYFDLSRIRMPKDVYRYFHYDIAFSGAGDACALSMAGVREWKAVKMQNEDGSYRDDLVPVVETDFTVRIKARGGDRIPFHKVRKLVLDIRQAGYHIALFTADLKNMSEDTQQLLMQAGIDTGDLSLDKKLQPYFTFRDIVQEGRWVCHYMPLLVTELDNLEHDRIEGKIDHPTTMLDKESGGEEKSIEGSKDLADATAGAVYNAVTTTKKPMNMELMSQLIARAATMPQGPEEDMSKLVQPKVGPAIVGTKQGESISKINDIFKRLHPNR